MAFGGFYPSRVKVYPVTTAPEIVRQAKAELALPCVVIGGMTTRLRISTSPIRPGLKSRE